MMEGVEIYTLTSGYVKEWYPAGRTVVRIYELPVVAVLPAVVQN